MSVQFITPRWAFFGLFGFGSFDGQFALPATLPCRNTSDANLPSLFFKATSHTGTVWRVVDCPKVCRSEEAFGSVPQPNGGPTDILSHDLVQLQYQSSASQKASPGFRSTPSPVLYIILYIILYYSMLYYIMLYYVLLNYIILYHIILYYIILYHIILYNIILYNLIL